MSSASPQFPPGYAGESIGYQVTAASCVFIPLSTLAVALRCVARQRHVGRFGADDYLIAPALLFGLGICTLSIIEIRIAGVGKHLAPLMVTDPQAVVNWAKCGYAIEQLYSVAVAFPKLSILASYLRIFTQRNYRIIAYAVGTVIICTAFAGVVTSLASCRPFSARWNLALFPTHCIDAPKYWQGMSVPNIVTDVVMLFLPMPVIWHLAMRPKQKVALTGVLLLGSLGMIASILRLTATTRVDTLTDGTWVSADILMWSVIEPNCYLIAACLPPLRPMFASFIRGLRNAGVLSSLANANTEPSTRSTPSHNKYPGQGDQPRREDDGSYIELV